MRTPENRRRANLAARFFLLMLALGALAAILILTFTFLEKPAAGDLGPGASDLNPVERFLLAAYLSARAADLAAPAGGDVTPVIFSVEQGETAEAVAGRLAQLGLVHDAQLLSFYMRYEGFDNSVEAGEFVLRQTMTIPEVAAALANAQEREVSVRIVEGWRTEQIAASLSANPDLDVSESDFLALAGPNGPRAGGYSFLGDLPSGASLEGFLFPDTYFARPGASAPDLIHKMLANFEARLPANYRAKVAAHRLTLYQAITIASLIEREAAVSDERPLVASVILNRLAIGQKLEIDATVQYAVGTPENWWPNVGGLDFRRIESPYNTYYIPGLPAGPIANPGLDSILAVADPAETNYYYYRALCDGSHRHAFAVTYEEHLANTCP